MDKQFGTVERGKVLAEAMLLNPYFKKPAFEWRVQPYRQPLQRTEDEEERGGAAASSEPVPQMWADLKKGFKTKDPKSYY